MDGKMMGGRIISESEVGTLFLPLIFLPLTLAHFTQQLRVSGGDGGRFDFWQRNGEQGNVPEKSFLCQFWRVRAAGGFVEPALNGW